MNKLILFLVIFIALAVGITSGMIVYKNKESDENNLLHSGDFYQDSGNSIVNDEENKEKQEDVTITKVYHQNIQDDATAANTYGYYDENDLTWEKVAYEDDKIRGEYYQISGLKNKTIEQQVNEKLKNSAIEDSRKQYELNPPEDDIGKIIFKQYKMSSFGNIISVSNLFANVYSYEDEYNESYYPSVDNTYMNINLNTGEELLFEDLFTSDADILGIVRENLYTLMGDDYQTITIAEYEWREIYNSVDERKLEKMIHYYKTTEDIRFGFTPSTLYISFPEYSTLCEIWLYNYRDSIAIYSRFLSSQSIYENDNIGISHIQYFSDLNPENIVKYAIINEEDDGVILDYVILSDIENKELEEKIISDINKKVQEEVLKLRSELQSNEIAYYSNAFIISEIVENWENNDYSEYYAERTIDLKEYMSGFERFFYCRQNPSIYIMTREEYEEKFYEYIYLSSDVYFWPNELDKQIITRRRYVLNWDEYLDWIQPWDEKNVYEYKFRYEDEMYYNSSGEYLNLNTEIELLEYLAKPEISMEKALKQEIKNKYLEKLNIELTDAEIEEKYAKIDINLGCYHKVFDVGIVLKDNQRIIYTYVTWDSTYDSGKFTYSNYDTQIT